MDFIKILFLVFAGLFGFLLIAFLISGFYNRQRKRELKREKLPPKKELRAYLQDITFKRNVFCEYYFTVKDKSSRSHHRVCVDAIVVCKGGILVLTVCDKGGKIDNSDKDVWVCIKDDERFDFESPLIKANESTYAVSNVLKRAGFKDAPIYSAVIFTDNTAIPLAGDDDVFSITELDKLLHDLKKANALDNLEQFYITNALRSAGITRDKIVKNKL